MTDFKEKYLKYQDKYNKLVQKSEFKMESSQVGSGRKKGSRRYKGRLITREERPNMHPTTGVTDPEGINHDQLLEMYHSLGIPEEDLHPTEPERRVPEMRTAFPSEPVRTPVRTPIRRNVPRANLPDRFGRMNVGVSADQLIDEYQNYPLDPRVREMRTAAPGTPLLDSPRPRRRVSEMRTAQPVNQPIS